MKETPLLSNFLTGIEGLNKSMFDRQMKLDLGGKWTENELDVFLQGFRHHGMKDLKALQNRLRDSGFDRSAYNVMSLYIKNKQYLDQCPDCSASELLDMMEEQCDTLSQDKSESFLSMTNKRKQSIGGSTDLNDEEPPVQKSKKRGSTRTVVNINRTVLKNPRKASPTKRLFSSSDADSEENFLSHVDIISQKCSARVSKKPTIKTNGTKIMKENDIPMSFARLLYYDHFYSHIDRAWFNRNEFINLIRQLRIDENTGMTRKDWDILRMVIGKPRRFSTNFVDLQRKSLYEYRNKVKHEIMSQALPGPPFLNNSSSAFAPFTVGQNVLALHPVCKHLHRGSIVALQLPFLIVKFMGNDAGVYRIDLIHIKILETKPENKIPNAKDVLESRFNAAFGLTSFTSSITDEVDWHSAAFLLKVLERKQALIQEMKQFNDLAQRNMNNLNEKYFQEYAWITLNINLLDNTLKHILAKFRLRGVNNMNQSMTAKSLTTLLEKPLRDFLDNEIANSNEDKENIALLKQLKTIMNHSLERKISKEICSVLDDFEIKENGIMKDEKIELEAIVESCIGVLLSIKENGELNPINNKFLRDLGEQIFETNPDEFYAISNILLELSNKN